MSNKTRKTTVIEAVEDLNLQEDFGTEDDLLTEIVATPVEPQGLEGMDYSAFEQGIEDITEESEDLVKALFYGPNGTGKTTAAGTFPGPVLILDFNEKGTKPLVGTGAQKRFIDTFDLFQMAYWYLRTGNHPYKTVVLDTVTNLQEIAMRWIMKKEQNWDATKDMDMPTKRDWGGLSQVMKRWLLDFRNLPMNVVFVAQERRSDSDDLDGDEATVFPQLSGSVRGILGGAVDVIGNTYIREVDDEQNPGKTKIKFCMRIGPNAKYVAKCRTPRGAKCPASIVNPSYAALQKIMKGLIK